MTQVIPDSGDGIEHPAGFGGLTGFTNFIYDHGNNLRDVLKALKQDRGR